MKNSSFFTLKLVCYGSVALSILLVVLFELDIVPMSLLEPNTMFEFVVTYVMELATIVFVWLSLRLLKFKFIQRWIVGIESKKQSRYANFALVRMLLNCVPMVLNIVCYYVFVSATFSGLAAIHLVTLLFMLPTKDRAESELASIMPGKSAE